MGGGEEHGHPPHRDHHRRRRISWSAWPSLAARIISRSSAMLAEAAGFAARTLDGMFLSSSGARRTSRRPRPSVRPRSGPVLLVAAGGVWHLRGRRRFEIFEGLLALTRSHNEDPLRRLRDPGRRSRRREVCRLAPRLVAGAAENPGRQRPGVIRHVESSPTSDSGGPVRGSARWWADLAAWASTISQLWLIGPGQQGIPSPSA